MCVYVYYIKTCTGSGTLRCHLVQPWPHPQIANVIICVSLVDSGPKKLELYAEVLM